MGDLPEVGGEEVSPGTSYQPIREDTTTMTLELGSATFQQAHDLWEKLKKRFY